MASITPYTTSGGERRYRVRYRKPDRSQTDKRGFATKRDAELFLAGVTVSKNRGEYVDPTAARVTVTEFGARWVGSRTHLKPSTLRVVEMAWRVHVQPVWGSRNIGQVVHTEVQSWVSQMTDRGLSATSVIRNFGVLNAILEGAVRDRRISANPARGVDLPRKVKKQRRYLTHDEVWRVATAAGEQGTIVLLLAYTGLRWGEATGLRVKHIDTLRRRLNITENAVSYGSVVHVGTPKTHQARSVPYPQFLSEPIARLCEGKTRDQLLLGEGFTHLRRPKTTDGNTSWFMRALAEAGVERMTIHDMRHTAASLAVSAGANVKAVQRMLGHASAAMTLDT